MAAQQGADGEEQDGGGLHDDGAPGQAAGVEVHPGERQDSGGDEEWEGVGSWVGHLLESMTQPGAEACNAIS